MRIKQPLDLVIDDLACVRDGSRASLGRLELAAEALEWIFVLMRQAKVKHVDTLAAVYSSRAD